MPPRRPTSPVLRAVLAPLEAFFRLEAAGGLVLVGAAALALCWANSPWADRLTALGGWDLGRALPGSIHLPLTHGVNDGLMTLFFLVVGLEIKRELAAGELSSLRKAALPALAALGGMAVPAAIYLAFNRAGPAAHGWGIPIATDIAFSIGCVRLFPGRIARGMVVFLTALAIFDDLGGIAVIALFYGSGIHGGWLLLAAAVVAGLALWHRSAHPPRAVDAVALIALWALLHRAGVHPTLAGVALGLALPSTPERGGPSRLERYERLLHPVVAFAIVPLFALFNAGVSLAGLSSADLLHPVALGVAVGLWAGKQLGIFGITALAVRLRISPMPGQAGLVQLWAVSAIAGIGFTVSLFVGSLAFAAEEGLLGRAKLGILAGSCAAAAVGLAIVRLGVPRAKA